MDIESIAAESVTYFQPLVRLGGGVVGHEALSRWPARPPREVFAAAGAAGAAGALDRACAERAIAAAAGRAGVGSLFLNVLPDTLADPELVGALRAALAAANIAESAVVLEIGESAPIGNEGALAAALARARAAGFRIALDDVGAGHCGLRRIADLAPDIVKLDRGLVAGLGGDARRRAVVRAVVGLARELGMAVVAEGIETPDELAAARALGVDIGQGYLLGRPDPALRPGADGLIMPVVPAGAHDGPLPPRRRPRVWPFARPRTPRRAAPDWPCR